MYLLNNITGINPIGNYMNKNKTSVYKNRFSTSRSMETVIKLTEQ